MFLTDTDDTLEVVMGSAVTTTAPDFVISYADHNAGADTFTPGKQHGVLNGTTTVTMVAAPGSGVQRQIKAINIYNADSVNKIIIVKYDDNGTERILVRASVPTLEVLTWSEAAGWRVGNNPATIDTDVIFFQLVSRISIGL